MPIWVASKRLVTGKVKPWYSAEEAGIREVDITSNLEAHWKFEEASGSIMDETANNNDGTYNGALYQQAGHIGYALGFDGTNDYVDFGTGASLQIASNGSISFWVYQETETNDYVYYFDGRDSGAGNHVGQIYRQKTTGTIDSNPAGTKYVDGELGDVVGLDGWHHVCITGFAIAATSQTYLGINHTLTADRFFDGNIDDLRIYSRVLTAGQIAYLYSL